MTFLFYTVAFCAALFILILVHETGHFLVAICFKVRVERFSIGFGKPLYSWKSKNGVTELVLAPFLLGGYVKLLDTRETKIPLFNHRFAFDKKAVWQRICIIAAGPVANFVFAFFAFWLMFIIGFKSPKPIIGEVLPDSMASYAEMRAGEEIIQIDNRATDNWPEVIIAMLNRVGDPGKLIVKTKVDSKEGLYRLDLARWRLDDYNPDPLSDFGLVRFSPSVLPVIYEIDKNSPAAKSDLQVGDHIVSIDGELIKNWEDFIRKIKMYPDKRVKMLVKRDKKPEEIAIDVGWKFGRGWKKIGFLGVRPDIEQIVWPEGVLRYYKYGFLTAFLHAYRQVDLFIDLNRIILGKLVVGKISSSVLGGPITIFATSGKALEQGFIAFLGFLAVISLTIAFLNLLPLPGLDGGYLILLVIEAIRRRPISLKTQNLIFRLGIAVFLVLLLHTTINDLIRIFG